MIIKKIKKRIENKPRFTRFFYSLINWKECILGIFYFVLFFCERNKKGRVLMVEAQPWHGEILPGYVKYFNDFVILGNFVLFCFCFVSDEVMWHLWKPAWGQIWIYIYIYIYIYIRKVVNWTNLVLTGPISLLH